jgi:hypothetical protein
MIERGVEVAGEDLDVTAAVAARQRGDRTAPQRSGGGLTGGAGCTALIRTGGAPATWISTSGCACPLRSGVVSVTRTGVRDSTPDPEAPSRGPL